MSGVEEVLQKFDELEKAMKTHLPKVDPQLIVDLILRQKTEKNPTPIYTVESFIKEGQNINEVSKLITRVTGQVPAFYDKGTHVVVAHKLDFGCVLKAHSAMPFFA